jgi:hypothetical protein
MIEATERMTGKQNNPATNRHFELEIKTLLQNAPRDAHKLEALLKAKGRLLKLLIYIGYLPHSEWHYQVKIVFHLSRRVLYIFTSIIFSATVFKMVKLQCQPKRYFVVLKTDVTKLLNS